MDFESSFESLPMAAPPLPVSPRPATGLAWTPLAAAMAAAAILAALVLARMADPRAATLGAALVLIVGGGFSLLLRNQRRAAEAAASAAVASQRRGVAVEAAAIAPIVSVLDALEDPVLVVSGDAEDDDLSSRRVIYANAAAGELFRTTREAAPLVTAVRDPKVLEVVDEA